MHWKIFITSLINKLLWMSDLKEENKILIFNKTLDVFQKNISRMSKCSFLIRGWTVGLLTLSSLFLKDLNNCYLLLCMIIPIICLWYMNANFLSSERNMRKEYLDVLKTYSINKNMLSGDDTDDLFEYSKIVNCLNIKPLKNTDESIIDAMLSPTLISFYGGLIVFIIFIVCVLFKLGTNF